MEDNVDCLFERCCVDRPGETSGLSSLSFFRSLPDAPGDYWGIIRKSCTEIVSSEGLTQLVVNQAPQPRFCAIEMAASQLSPLSLT